MCDTVKDSSFFLWLVMTTAVGRSPAYAMPFDPEAHERRKKWLAMESLQVTRRDGAVALSLREAQHAIGRRTAPIGVADTCSLCCSSEGC
jgi:hypothetical protein